MNTKYLKRNIYLSSIMPRSTADSESGQEPLIGNVTNSSTHITKRYRQKCCYLVWLLLGTSVPLVLGFYMGYNYEEDNCSCGSN